MHFSRYLPLSLLFNLCWGSKFPSGIIFFHPGELPSAYLIVQVCRWKLTLVLFYVKMSLCSLHFAGYIWWVINSGLTIFYDLSALWNYYSILFQASQFLLRNWPLIRSLFPCIGCVIFLFLLSRFAFYLWISTVWLRWAMVRASLCLFCLVFIHHNVPVYFSLSSNLLFIGHSFFKYFLYSILSPLF